jgi:hypothetical protein
MKTIRTNILLAGLGLAAIHSCFAASSTIEFAQGGFFDAFESVATAIVEVRRTGDTNSTARIDYATVEGTAKPGVDYVPELPALAAPSASRWRLPHQECPTPSGLGLTWLFVGSRFPSSKQPPRVTRWILWTQPPFALLNAFIE